MSLIGYIASEDTLQQLMEVAQPQLDDGAIKEQAAIFHALTLAPFSAETKRGW